MQIHRVRGDDLNAALLRARSTHGEDALVLGHELSPDGGVTLAVQRPPRGALAKQLTGGAGRADLGLRDLARRLVLHGCSPRFAREIALEVQASGARGTAAIDAGAEAIGRRIALAKLPKVGPKKGRAPHVVAFVGPTGAGKTTTLAKLAVRLAQARRSVSIVSLDDGRVGALAELEAYGALLEVQVEAAGDAAELGAALARRRQSQVVLVDTAGQRPGDADEIQALATALGRAARGLEGAALETYLVLSATTQSADHAAALRAFAPLRPTAGVATKLDETARPGGVLEALARAELGLAFLSASRDAAGALVRPSADQIADLLLRGRLA